MKKIIALLLSLTMALSLAACGTQTAQEDTKATRTVNVESGDSAEEGSDGLVQAQKISEVVCTYEGEEQWRLEYQYTDGEGLTDVVEYSYGNKLMTASYDGSIDRLTAQTVYYSNGKENYRITYQYDDGGRLLQKEQESESGTSTDTYEYNEYGDVSAIITEYSDGGGRTDTYEYEYDASGRKAQKILTRDGEEVYRNTYSYSDSGKVVEVISYRDGEEKNRDTYEYDEAGRLITAVEYYLGGELNRTTYLYDSDGWLMGMEETYGTVTVEYDTVTVTAEEAQELAKISESLL